MIGVRPRRLLFIFCAAAILVAFTRSIPHRLPFRRSGPPTSHSRSRLAAASHNASYTPQLLDDDFVKALEAQLLALASQGTLPKRGLLTDVRRIVQMSRPPDPDDDHLDTSWSRLNPDWGYELMYDVTIPDYLATVYTDAPAVLTLFDALPRKIMQLDLARLLVIYAESGIYADSDAICLRPVQTWPIAREHFNSPEIELVVGVQVDEPTADAGTVAKWGWSASFELQCGTFIGRQYSPALRQIILTIATNLIEYARTHRRTSDNIMRSRLHNRDVIKLTGPGAFTEGVVDYLRRDTQLGPTFRLEDLAGVDVPLRVGSVLFLPSRFWTPGQRHSRSGAINGPDACVRHLFAGSWWKGRRFWQSY